jgi:hypothetical protein
MVQWFNVFLFSNRKKDIWPVFNNLNNTGEKAKKQLLNAKLQEKRKTIADGRRNTKRKETNDIRRATYIVSKYRNSLKHDI